MLAIRSKDRDPSTSTSSSDFRIKLSQPIRGSYYLSHALISNSMYTVRQNCSAFSLSLQGGGIHAFTLDPGYYTGTTLCAAVELGIRGAMGNSQFGVELSERTGRVTISGPIAFSLLWGGLENSLAPLLGFSQTSTGFATSHAGTELMDLTHRTLTFNVVVDCPGVDFQITSTMDHHASFLIANEENSLDYISWNERTRYPQRIHFRTPTRQLHISLVDSEFRPTDLNGAEWHLLLRPAC